jgi:cephalosporin-C deacetylase-like acetyl esterase
MNITDRVKTRLEETQANPQLLKFFKFSMEDLIDKPQESLDTITEYFETHKDHIEDFSFISYIDEESMAPRIVAVIDLKDSLKQHLSSPHLTKLTNVTLKKENLKNE